MEAPAVTETFRATIDSLAFGGSGVCRVNGKVCFVPFSCPGDELELRLVSEKRSYQEARICSIVRPSPDRRDPFCPLFGECGGCDWQQVAYERQLAAKRDILANALWRSARVEPDRVGQTAASGLSRHYRQRVRFKVGLSGDALRIGFYRGQSHAVVDAAAGCPVAAQPLNAALRGLRPLLDAAPHRAAITELALHNGLDGVTAVVYCRESAFAPLQAYLADAAKAAGGCSALFLVAGRGAPVRLQGQGHIRYELPAGEGRQVTLQYSPGGFAQVNQAQNAALLDLVREFGAFDGTGSLLDLYCGNGNFSLPLAGAVATIVGYEGNRGSIASARDNCRVNGIANASYHDGDAAAAVRQLVAAGRRMDTVLLDPPRAGAAELVGDLPLLAPDRIIYISCDPATLARDCGHLATRGYRVERAVPVDMFPQTYHVESIVLLVRT